MDRHLAIFAVVIIPELFTTLLLLPLSILVINSSDNLTDVLVNLVALQVFSQIDDVLVRILLRPAGSLGRLLDIYLAPYEECDSMIYDGTTAEPEGELALV